MRSNYKRLGEHIREVNIRNKDLEVDRLLGVSIQKIFIPSIANTVGTNMKNYKIVKNDQFVYGTVTSRNGDKISIAHLIDYDEAIVSQAYKVFEIIDKDKLLPKYLMMWFSRPEFDRYARYMSHGSTREVFGWGEICDVELPIPDIDIQREVVRDYETITQRVENNKNIIKKLESTAGAIYREWFVDFEFPNDTGKPYKSSGGEMEYNKELDMEMPVEWRVGFFGDEILTSIIGSGIDKFDGEKIYLATADIDEHFIVNFDTKINYKPRPSRANMQPITNSIWFAKMKNTKKNQLFLDVDSWNIENTILSTGFAGLKPKENALLYIYTIINIGDFEDQKNQLATGTTQEAINNKSLANIKYIIPDDDILDKVNELFLPMYKHISFLKKENIALEKMQSLLLSRMVEREEDLVV